MTLKQAMEIVKKIELGSVITREKLEAITLLFEYIMELKESWVYECRGEKEQ